MVFLTIASVAMTALLSVSDWVISADNLTHLRSLDLPFVRAVVGPTVAATWWRVGS